MVSDDTLKQEMLNILVNNANVGVGWAKVWKNSSEEVRLCFSESELSAFYKKYSSWFKENRCSKIGRGTPIYYSERFLNQPKLQSSGVENYQKEKIEDLRKEVKEAFDIFQKSIDDKLFNIFKFGDKNPIPSHPTVSREKAVDSILAQIKSGTHKASSLKKTLPQEWQIKSNWEKITKEITKNHGVIRMGKTRNTEYFFKK